MAPYKLKPEIQMVKDLSSILSSIDWSSIGESFQINNTQPTTEPTNPETPSESTTTTTEPTNPETPSESNQEPLNEIMDKILNKEKFSYDLNGDALYQQYKDKYLQQGKMAMEDAIGKASTMTGGYGNSYAQSVGQQEYQAQLENLNDIVPTLWQMAYDMYNKERQVIGSSGGSSSGGSSSGGGSSNQGTSGSGNTTSSIPDSVREKAARFEDNESLSAWAYSLEDSGVIAEGQAAQLISEFYDHNEKYAEVYGPPAPGGGSGSTSISYTRMVASTKGWVVVDDGGGNLTGIDKNAKVKAPNGETLTLEQLRNKLKDEEMSHSEATNAIKALQQNLGISSNWLFGL